MPVVIELASEGMPTPFALSLGAPYGPSRVDAIPAAVNSLLELLDTLSGGSREGEGEESRAMLTPAALNRLQSALQTACPGVPLTVSQVRTQRLYLCL